MKRTTKIVSLFVCGVLMLFACGFDLAQPEVYRPEQDRFIGFHLVYEKMPQAVDMSDPDWEEQFSDQPGRDYSQWTEYGSEAWQLDGIGSVDIPRMILIGKKDGNRYVFPGLEGKNCFLAIETGEDGSRIISGYTDMADTSLAMGDQETSISGTVYFGPPLDDRNWNTEDYDYCWTAYRVYQMEDGTVYLTGSGNSYGGVGGFTVSEKTQWTTTENGKTAVSSFEVTFSVTSIPRLEQVAIRQYDQNDQLLRTDLLTSDQAGDITDGLHLTLKPETAYVLAVETDVDGNAQRTIHQPGQSGERTIYFTSWFLDDAGMGYSVPVWLEP